MKTLKSISAIFEPFMIELNALETDAGLKVAINNKDFTLRATVTAVCGDTLAAYLALGFLGPGARHFCHVCMISRDVFSLNSFPDKIVYRSRDLHSDHIKQIEAGEAKKTECGVTENSALNRSRYFHAAENLIFDPMHDPMLEGQFMYCVKLVLERLITTRKKDFNLEKVHSRLKLFDCGPSEAKNKPSTTLTLPNLKDSKNHKLQQSASQTRCLIRILPFLISDFVTPTDPLMRILTTMNRILEIIFSPTLTHSDLTVLSELIKDYDSQFRQYFPSADYINKLHHLFHYARCCLMSGP